MVKQGQRAASKRLKQIKQIRRKKAISYDRTIAASQLAEFMLVRYGLTLKKKIPQTQTQTVQRFLQEWLVQAPKSNVNWSIAQVTTAVLKQLNCQVPWQFLAVLAQNWLSIQAFLMKELPAVPLKDRLVVTDELTVNQLTQLLSHQLATNFFLTTLGGNPQLLQQVAANKVMELQASLQLDDHIDWQRVSALFIQSFVVNEAADSGTRAWLQQLSQLKF